MITARLRCLNIRGCHTADGTDTDIYCNICDMHAYEADTHLLLHCEEYQDLRTTTWKRLKNTWTPKQWKTFRTADDNQKVNYLLGERLAGRHQPNNKRLQIDTITKEYLQEIDDRRINKHGKNSLVDLLPETDPEVTLRLAKEYDILIGEQRELEEKEMSDDE